MTQVQRSQGWRRWRRPLGALALGLAAGVIVAAILLKHEPVLPAVAPGPDTERAAARLVTKVAALGTALREDGSWGMALTDAEVNAWLATDLPRNHARLLPRGLSEPRVRFRPHRVEVAMRTGTGLFSTVVWCDLRMTLRGVNQLGITAEAAAAGAVPLPGGPVLAELGRRLAAAGAVAELRRLDARTVLVVYIPAIRGGSGTEGRLKSLRIDDGEVVVAGTTSGPVPDETP